MTEYSHCDIGNHDVEDQMVGICTICKRNVCHQHQGNPDVEPGSWVSCPDHIREVALMNRERLRRYRAMRSQE